MEKTQYKSVSKTLYFILPFIGFLIFVINNIIQLTPAPLPGEYYYSNFLRSNYSFISGGLLFITGVIVGFHFKYNPWITGILLISCFPLTAIYEATIYRGSHNLIPFELAVHFLFALPAVTGTYLGQFIRNKKDKSNN